MANLKIRQEVNSRTRRDRGVTRAAWFEFLVSRRIRLANQGPFPLSACGEDMQAILIRGIEQEVEALLDATRTVGYGRQRIRHA